MCHNSNDWCDVSELGHPQKQDTMSQRHPTKLTSSQCEHRTAHRCSEGSRSCRSERWSRSRPALQSSADIPWTARPCRCSRTDSPSEGTGSARQLCPDTTEPGRTGAGCRWAAGTSRRLRWTLYLEGRSAVWPPSCACTGTTSGSWRPGRRSGRQLCPCRGWLADRTAQARETRKTDSVGIEGQRHRSCICDISSEVTAGTRSTADSARRGLRTDRLPFHGTGTGWHWGWCVRYWNQFRRVEEHLQWRKAGKSA